MSPVALNGVDEQGVAVNGVQVLKTLNPANETVEKGVYGETTLSAVDADLAASNIKDGVTIFGKLGTVLSGGTETIEKYADATIAADATYTPGVSGIFYYTGGNTNKTNGYACGVYSDARGAWNWINGNESERASFMTIGDGTNFQIKNKSGGNLEYILMRNFYSMATYERARDEQLAANASWTPGNSGFFQAGGEHNLIFTELNLTTAGWIDAANCQGSNFASSLLIGDGTNLRIKNRSGSIAYYHSTMRAVMI